jgi:uncharacterized protein (DUF433 family)
MMMTGNQQNYHERITCTPGVVGGKPVITGTRIPVDMILERLMYDLDVQSIFEDYPQLSEDDIRACVTYAKELLDEELFVPTPHQEKPLALHP